MININNLPPFKKMCVTVGNLPTSFMESMSYYEALCWMYNYLDKTVIPAINTEGEAITELQNAFTTLKSYIDNYFENLDVQEEINNKLDDMAESGELTDIIAQYLGLAGVLAFNTVADMKAAENLVNGSTARTLGFYSTNDGGASLYKIRTITNSDTVDERRIIALSDENLVAELVLDNNIINIKQFGAYCDNTHDDSDALEACLNYTNTLASSTNTWKRTILIPAIVKVTRRIDCKIDQFKMTGTSLNNSRIVFDGANSYLNIGKDNNEKSFEIEIENIKLYGNYNNTNSILKMTKCNNCYLTRVETCNGGEDQYNISFIDCGIIFMDKCTITGSNDVENYPGNRNGIYINSIGSIFHFTNANCWNLNNVFKFGGLVQNINIESNWIECFRSLMEFDCATNMKCMNINLCKNTFNTHTQSTFVPTDYNFISFAMKDDTDFWNSTLNISDNTIYIWNVTTINNNSLIYFDKIGGSTSSTFNILFNNNIFSGKRLHELSAYVFYNSNSAFYNRYNVKFKSAIVNGVVDAQRLTDNKKIISCNICELDRGLPTYPNGVYLGSPSAENHGNIFYENNQFYAGYNGTVKQMPERLSSTSIPYATSETILTVLNQVTDILVNSHICNRQS